METNWLISQKNNNTNSIITLMLYTPSGIAESKSIMSAGSMPEARMKQHHDLMTKSVHWG